jgi:DNA-binding CsgD family transcriptional regulator
MTEPLTEAEFWILVRRFLDLPNCQAVMQGALEQAGYVSESPGARIVERRLRGETPEGIAEAEGMSLQAVKAEIAQARKFGVKFGDEHLRTYGGEQVKWPQVVKLRIEGMPPGDIARELNIKVGTVYSAITKARNDGVEFPPVVDPEKTWNELFGKGKKK